MSKSMKKKEKMLSVLEILKKLYGSRVLDSLKKNDQFRILIGAILSQRTRDENTAKAVKRLFSAVTHPQDILKLDEEELQRLIKPSGYYRQKTKKIKKLCEILTDSYGGRVPERREELLHLPGVGPKTADVVLCYGFNRPQIPIDIHVEVCSKRLGLVRKNARYEEIRETLESLTSIEDRQIVNLGLVRFGREFCRTRYPKCRICPMNHFCNHYG